MKLHDLKPARGAVRERKRVGRGPGSGLGKTRWVVESTLAWVGQARRLKIRYDVLPAMHRAFHYLQMARICCKCLQRDF